MNSCNFAGRLGGDAETRFTGNGKPVTGFSLAVDEYAGEGERKTLWVKCAMFGERGQKLAQYLLKGTPVAVSGRVGIDQWTGSDGNARADLKLRVDEVTLLGKRDDQQQGGRQEQRQMTNDRERARSAPPADDFSDDCPF